MRMRIGFSTRYASTSGPAGSGSIETLKRSASLRARSESTVERRILVGCGAPVALGSSIVGSTTAGVTAGSFVVLVFLDEYN